MPPLRECPGHQHVTLSGSCQWLGKSVLLCASLRPVLAVADRATVLLARQHGLGRREPGLSPTERDCNGELPSNLHVNVIKVCVHFKNQHGPKYRYLTLPLLLSRDHILTHQGLDLLVSRALTTDTVPGQRMTLLPAPVSVRRRNASASSPVVTRISSPPNRWGNTFRRWLLRKG
jgi:hypothetical protein